MTSNPKAPQAMTASIECAGRLCTIILNGEIDQESPKVLTEVLSDASDIGDILLESPGGNLIAAMEMGRMIRETGLGTRVGGATRRDREFINLCESACAYMFLGGANRSVIGDGKLGFHRFHTGNFNQALLPKDYAIEFAQDYSSNLLEYIIEMDVDPRIFVETSRVEATDMEYPGRDVLVEYDIVTPEDFSHFFIDPYKGGIVAASKRQTPTRIYDELLQLTALCIEGTPYLLYNSTVGDLPQEKMYFTFNETGETFEEIPATNVEVLDSANGASLKVQLQPEVALKIQQALYFRTGFSIPPVSGGEHRFELHLNEQDQKFLKAAFTLCI